MRFSIVTTLVLSALASGFNIITPHPDEVIDVDQLYNLTWTVDDILPNLIVSDIKVEFPGIAIVGPDDFYYLQGFGDDSSFNISGNDGYYQLNLSYWWSPLYDELPHGSWLISLELFDLGQEIPGLTAVNDSVNVLLTSPKRKQHHRPQLPSLTDFNADAEIGGLTKPDRALGIVAVALGVVIPILLFVLVITLARHRWKRHTRKTIPTEYTIQPCDRQDIHTGVNSQPSAKDPSSSAAKASGSGRVSWLFGVSACLAILPLVALLVVLISLLLSYHVKPSAHSRADFAYNESGSDPTAFYMDFDATQYTTVASWTSSIALLLPGFLTTLLWYRQSEELSSDVLFSRHDRLLTPYQLSLLLGLRSGTLGSLWDYLSYARSRHREKQSKFLSHTGFVVLTSTLLGYVTICIRLTLLTMARLGLWMADTWLHIETSTVSFTTSSRSGIFNDPFESWGRKLTPNCTSSHSAFTGDLYSCIMDPLLADVPPILSDPVQFIGVISGRDIQSDIATVTIGEERVAYIGPMFHREHLDYRANTYAVRSTCQTIDEWCYMSPQNGSNGTTFYPSTIDARCGSFAGVPFGWPNSTDPIAQGTIVSGGVVGLVTSFFVDQKWEEVMTVDNTANTFYTVSRIDSPIRPSPYGLPAHWSLASGSFPTYNNFIGCGTELVNLTYTYVNGSLRSSEISPLDSLDLMNAIFLPTLYNFDPFLTSGAGTTATLDDRELALENWIDTWHRHYLSLAVLAVEPAKNLDQQQRYSRLVARIPKAPLMTLGTLLLLSIMFNAWVLFHSLRRTDLRVSRPKQEMISIAGLAASAFDKNVTDHGQPVSKAWDLFQESKEETMSTRVGIGENPVGGHRFVAFSAGLGDLIAAGRAETVKAEAKIGGKATESTVTIEDSASGDNAIGRQ